MPQSMMQETELIADELQRASGGEAWHGPSIRETIATVNAEAALSRPIPGAHSIWEIVLHLTAWVREVERRLRDRAQPLVGAEDWPPVEGRDEEAWSRVQQGLIDAHAKLRQAIREFAPGRLDEDVPFENGAGTEGSFYLMLHGLAQHDAYHTGQIAILRKGVRS